MNVCVHKDCVWLAVCGVIASFGTVFCWVFRSLVLLPALRCRSFVDSIYFFFALIFVLFSQ